MFEVWIRPEDWAGAPALFVSLWKEDLGEKRFAGRVTDLSALKERAILRDGKVAGRFWYRTGQLAEKSPAD